MPLWDHNSGYSGRPSSANSHARSPKAAVVNGVINRPSHYYRTAGSGAPSTIDAPRAHKGVCAGYTCRQRNSSDSEQQQDVLYRKLPVVLTSDANPREFRHLSLLTNDLTGGAARAGARPSETVPPRARAREWFSLRVPCKTHRLGKRPPSIGGAFFATSSVLGGQSPTWDANACWFRWFPADADKNPARQSQISDKARVRNFEMTI
jgi:hypothetical protein